MNDLTNQPGKYYSELVSLTPKENITSGQKLPIAVENSPLNLLFSPFFIYGIIILFFVLFLGAIIIQIIQRVLTWKSAMTTLVVVFTIMVIPVTLKSVLQSSAFQVKAAPDEIPKKIIINQVSATSLEVVWETDIEKMGSVKIGIFPLDSKTSRTVIANSGNKTTKHQVLIFDLKPKNIYEIEILSGSNWYNDQNKPIKFELK